MKKLFRLFYYLGHPVYLLLRFPFRFRFRRIIYRAPHLPFPSLKSFLKSVYPLLVIFSRFHLPRFHPPRLHFPKLKLKFRFYVASTIFVAISASTYWFLLKDLPSPKSLTEKPIPLTTHIRDRHGVELYKIYASQNRTLVKLNDLPLNLRQAVISIEDAEFYKHSGFSLRGTLRASWRILTQNHVEGGSTITQQLVKTSLLSPERTLRRKLRELLLAVAVEISYSKDQILEMYLNRVSFGGATYGVEEAAQTYFGKAAHDLDLAESSLLAGLPASPTTYSPFGVHPELAKTRQKEVLRRMVSEGFITWDQAEAASTRELVFRSPATDIKAPHFVMYIKDLLAQKYGTQLIEQGGLDVITSLDLATQQLAQTAVTQEIAKVSYLHIGNGAALVMDPRTGEILAMVGSKDYFDNPGDGNVNVTLSLRQPGSSIKPINYALALTHGFTPASLIDDSPITYRTPGLPPYTPVNYDGRFHGKVSLRLALASSYNVPAVKILAANGVANMIALGQKMGITTWADPSRFGLSLTLGGGEVTMLDMAKAYSVFANLGSRVDLHPILSVRDSSGKVLEEFRCDHQVGVKAAEAATEITTCNSEGVLDPRVAYLISDILSDNSARAPAFSSNSDLNIPKVAVKTGTTNNLRDNWTIGYSPGRLVVVWVGNNDNSPMSYVASGVTGASPIWRRIMSSLLATSPSPGFPPPTNLIKVNICTITGQLTCEGCPSRSEYFLPGTEPKIACTKEAIQKIQEDKAQKEQRERDRLLNGSSTNAQ